MLTLLASREKSRTEGLQHGGRTCRCSSWRLSGVSNNKSGQRLNGALVAAYVIVNLDHMALDLILCESAETGTVTWCIRIGRLARPSVTNMTNTMREERHTVTDTNLAPPFARTRQEHRPRAYTIVYRYAAPINMPVHCSRFTRK
jgi:hypothetical protein